MEKADKISGMSVDIFTEKTTFCSRAIEKIVDRMTEILPLRPYFNDVSDDCTDRFTLIELQLNVISFYSLVNEYSILYKNTSDKDSLLKARLYFEKALGQLEEVFGSTMNYIYTSKIQKTVFTSSLYEDLDVFKIMHKMGFTLDRFAESWAKAYAGQELFLVDLKARFAVLIKNSINFSLISSYLFGGNIQTTDYLFHFRLMEILFSEVASRYKALYENSGYKQTQYFHKAILFLQVLKKIYLTLNESFKLTNLEIKVDAWNKQFLENQQRKS